MDELRIEQNPATGVWHLFRVDRRGNKERLSMWANLRAATAALERQAEEDLIVRGQR